MQQLSEEFFPSGFYRFTRRSFINEEKFVIGLVYVFRDAGVTYIKGFEAKEAMYSQGLSATFGEGHRPWSEALRFLACAELVASDGPAPPATSPSVARLPATAGGKRV